MPANPFALDDVSAVARPLVTLERRRNQMTSIAERRALARIAGNREGKGREADALSRATRAPRARTHGRVPQTDIARAKREFSGIW
jgi:hypothetical protein